MFPVFQHIFIMSKLLETEIKDMSRRALARCEVPSDEREGKEEFDGKGKEMLLVSFYSLYLSCFLSRKCT